jgi:hypothetical protein
MARTLPGTWRPARRLFVEGLEVRAVPAFDLAIDGNVATAQVSTTVANTTTTFAPLGPGAVLNVADIATALATGDVVITTGTAGSAGGSINWTWDDPLDDLTFTDPGARTLTLNTDASATLGDVEINGAHLTFADNVHLVVDTTAPAVDGEIRLINDARVDDAAAVTLSAGTGAVRIDSASPARMADSGNIVVNAGTLQNQFDGFVLGSELGNVTINAPIDLSLAGLGIRSDAGAVTLNGPVNGAGSLSLYGLPVVVNAAVGATTPLTLLTFAGGNASFTGAITAGNVEVGDNVFDAAEATVTGAGTITANVTVNFDGAVAPGGVGASGQMSITGNLTFVFGNYALDLGATPDRINVTGDLDISGGNLGTAASTGVLANNAPVTVIGVTGTVTGAFDNAPLNTGAIVGTDAVQVTGYDSATGVTIARVAAAPKGTVSGAEADGTGFTVKLTGAGELAAFIDASGQLGIAVRNSTAKTKFKITTKANASDATVNLGRAVVNGDLAEFNAAPAVLTDSFTMAATAGTTGGVKSLSFYQAFGTVETPGAIGSLAVRTNCFAAVNAGTVGKVQVGQILSGLAPWLVTDGVGSLIAARIVGLDVTAKFVGSVTTKGDTKNNLSGDILQSTFRLTGSDGTPKAYGLKTLSAKGTVQATTFNVQQGSVGTVTVGRFIDSNLYVAYDPTATFDAAGGFNSATAFRVERFSTTATTIGDPTNPVNWAFAGSQIAVDTLGTVKLSGLKTANAGGPIGIKFQTAGGAVQVKSADNAAISPKGNLSPSATALANDFFYVDG